MKVLIELDNDMFKDIRESDFESSRKIVRDFQATISDSIRNGTPIPDNATNGDMIKAIFPNASVSEIFPIGNYDEVYYVIIEFEDGVLNEMRVMKSWWNAPYKGVEE